jgi:hypothetical protein
MKSVPTIVGFPLHNGAEKTHEETISMARFSKFGLSALDSHASPRHNCNACFFQK